MVPGHILGHKSTHEFLRVIFIEGQKILRNITHALLRIFGQYSGDPSSFDIPKISVEID